MPNLLLLVGGRGVKLLLIFFSDKFTMFIGEELQIIMSHYHHIDSLKPLFGLVVLKQFKCLVVKVFILLHHTGASLKYQQYHFVICFSSPRTGICDLICVSSVHFFLPDCNPNTKTLFQREMCTCIATFLLESHW